MTRGSLSRAQARRVALAAQGFADRRPARVHLGSLARLLDRIALLQIDSVNVAVRAHYMPVFSRLGPYDVGILHRAAGSPPRRVFEYWGHEASFLRIDLYPALRFRMREAHEHMWGGPLRLAQTRPEFVKRVLEDVRARGPVTARDIEDDAARDRTDWGWNWSDAKKALEYLFYSGDITSAGRTVAFERRYDLTERVIPRAVYEQPEIDKAEAHRRLVRAAAKAHGVASAQCLRDYFRTSPEPTKVAIAELVEAGELEPVSVEGWRRAAYLFHQARLPRRVEGRALLCPFDPLIFERSRTEQLFDFRYRVEIYVPAAKRVHGYYVFPFLFGDRLAARVDLKSDRAAGVLRVLGAFAERRPADEMVAALAGSLTEMAAWQGLDSVSVASHGDLAAALARVLTGRAVDLAPV